MSNSLKKGNFFILPNSLFDFSPQLSPTEFVLYSYLCRCSNASGQSFPSYNDIMKKCNIRSKATVKKAIDRLVEINLLKFENRVRKGEGWTSNLYTILDNDFYPQGSTVNELGLVKKMDKGSSFNEQGIVQKMNWGSTVGVQEQNPYNNTQLTKLTYQNQSVRHDSAEKNKSSEQILEDINNYTDLIKSNIGYDEFSQQRGIDMGLIDNFISIIVDTVFTQDSSVLIQKEMKPIAIVKSNYSKLDYEDIEYALDKFTNNSELITKKREFIRSLPSVL